MKVLICGDYIVYGDSYPRSTNPFGEFQEIIKGSDFSIYNQEFPVTTSTEIYSTKKYGLTSATDPKAIQPISEAGFTHASLANNHIFNRGKYGLSDTISNLKKARIKTFGAGTTMAEANAILYEERDNKKIAFLNYAENEFNCATKTHGGANPFDVVTITNQIIEAKKKADFVFLIIHGGIDFCEIPSPRMVKTYRFFADMGASAIIGHHTHVVSGYEVYNSVPIFYGIGNFIPGKIVVEGCKYSFPVRFELLNDGKLTYDGYPLKYDVKQQQIEILKGTEKADFLERQKEISSLLSDLDKLEKTLKSDYLTAGKESYYYTLFTRSNYFLFKLLRKLKLTKLYHRYIRRKMRLNTKNSISWNLNRCETHRDVLDLIYSKHIDLYKNN